MSTLSLTISIPGIIVFIAAMIPNFAYMLLAPQEQIEKERKNSHLNAEDLSRDFFVFFLVAFSSETKGSIIYLIVALVFLALYYITWFRYFKNGKDEKFLLSPLGFIPVPLAIFPNIYFIFASLYLENMLAFGLCLVFAFFHIKSALNDAKKKEESK